jgi:hypothetical protein
VLGEALDRAALAGGVAALEHHDDAAPGVLDPVLELEQLDLQQSLVPLVLLTGQALLVGVALPPGVDRRAVGTQQPGSPSKSSSSRSSSRQSSRSTLSPSPFAPASSLMPDFFPVRPRFMTDRGDRVSTVVTTIEDTQ